MAYRDDIIALGADHLYVFETNYSDSIGSGDGTGTGTVLTGTAISEDCSNSAVTNTIANDRITLPTLTNVNNAVQARKVVCGWFSISEFSPHPVRIYGEGTTATGFQFCLGYGNSTLLEAISSSFSTGLQVFGIPLVPGRAYHLCGIFSGSGFDNRIRFFIDGVEQLSSAPDPATPGVATLASRGVAQFGDPSGTSIGLGGSTVLMQAATNGSYNQWAMWGDSADAELTDTEIRIELFEKGALPETTISSGTESDMQASLDALSSTARSNEPLCIRVEANTGDTDFTLSASDITFDPLASIHVQYTGDSVLTWRNDNDSNASIFSTTGAGSIVVQNQTRLDITGLPTQTEIRVFAAGTTDEVTGQEDVNSGLFESFVYEDSVDIMIVALEREILRIESVDTSTDTVLQVTPAFDRNYS